jgi:hypothetical protein
MARHKPSVVLFLLVRKAMARCHLRPGYMFLWPAFAKPAAICKNSLQVIDLFWPMQAECFCCRAVAKSAEIGEMCVGVSRSILAGKSDWNANQVVGGAQQPICPTALSSRRSKSVCGNDRFLFSGRRVNAKVRKKTGNVAVLKIKPCRREVVCVCLRQAQQGLVPTLMAARFSAQEGPVGHGAAQA